MRFGAFLLAQLERHGVTHVFGIPGVHTGELYRGLAGSPIRHVTPRHEQGAGFMADGYARLTGWPGVCFVITGPGLTNIATAMGQAYQDSIPLLVISGVNARRTLGHSHGHLHELPDQQHVASGLAAFSHTLLRPKDLPEVLARAFAVFHAARPRPVHIEIPLDVMEAEVGDDTGLTPKRRVAPPSPPGAALDEAVRRLEKADRPLMLVGGGARRAAGELPILAERLDAPLLMTINGRGLMPFGHPLAVPASPSLRPVRQLVAEADVVLAIGTEIGPTDYDMYADGGFALPGTLIRAEIDPLHMTRSRMPEVALLGDAPAAVDGLLERLGGPRDRAGAVRAAATREAAFASLSAAMQEQVRFLDRVRDALPRCIIVGDSTQPVYAGNLYFEARSRHGWFNSATGYGTLGYALPAAIGAKLGAPDRPVVCLIGDGGLQFTLGELGAAMDARTPIIVLVWNNRGYGEIETYMRERGIEPEGVRLTTPDFVAIAQAYGLAAERLLARDDLHRLVSEAAQRAVPTLIEIDEAVIMG